MRAKKSPADSSPIDTSHMSAGQKAAVELTEAAREQARSGFISRLFMGRCDFSRLFLYTKATSLMLLMM